MAYVLRFVQRFRVKDDAAFMALEAQEVYEVLDLPGRRRTGKRRAS